MYVSDSLSLSLSVIVSVFWRRIDHLYKWRLLFVTGSGDFLSLAAISWMVVGLEAVLLTA